VGGEPDRGPLMAELLDGLGVALVDLLGLPQLIGAILLGSILPVGAVRDGKAAGDSKAAEGLHQGGADVIRGLELLLGGEPMVRVPGEPPRADTSTNRTRRSRRAAPAPRAPS
jgi:hypothetical protein